MSGFSSIAFNINSSAISVCVCMHKCKHLFYIVHNNQEHTENRRKGRINLTKKKKNYRDLKEWLLLNKGIVSLLTIFDSRKESLIRIFTTSEVSGIVSLIMVSQELKDVLPH